jgi:hypothetical protein
MKLMMLFALLIYCFSIQAHAAGLGEPGDIAVPSKNAPNMDMPEPIITGPNMDMPAPNPIPLGKFGKNPDQALNKTSDLSSNQQATQMRPKPEPMNISGKWSIEFNDSADRSLDLNLWSSSGIAGVMGFGTLMDEGTGNSVTAMGSATEQKLRLSVKSATSSYLNEKYDECDLDLFKVNDKLSGTYTLKSKGQTVFEGNATAVRQ